MIDLNQIAKECKRHSDKRKENGGIDKNEPTLKHCAGEFYEAVQAKGYYLSAKAHALTEDEVVSSLKLNFGKELADIIICCLVEMESCGMDSELLLNMGVEKNRNRAEGKGDKK